MYRVENNYQNSRPTNHTHKGLQHQPTEIERDGGNDNKGPPAQELASLIHWTVNIAPSGRSSNRDKRSQASD
jgi:hypothetical protein